MPIFVVGCVAPEETSACWCMSVEGTTDLHQHGVDHLRLCKCSWEIAQAWQALAQRYPPLMIRHSVAKRGQPLSA